MVALVARIAHHQQRVAIVCERLPGQQRFGIGASSPSLLTHVAFSGPQLSIKTRNTKRDHRAPIPSQQVFVPVNNYTFDGLYRRHHPLDHRCDEDHRHVDNERDMVTRGGGDDGWCSEGKRDGAIAQEESLSRPAGPCRSSPTAADPLPGAAGGSCFAKRMESIMQEEYGTFFDGMTQSATELYQVVVPPHTSKKCLLGCKEDLTESSATAGASDTKENP